MAESIGKLLECSICLEQMVLPKILPCFHTFCLACLCKIESKENKLQCPECRKVHNLPNDGAKGFNNNYRLAALIDDLHTVPSAPPLELECQPQVCPQKPEIMSQHSNNSEPGLKVRALYDYEAAESDELNFKAGDVLEILEDEDEQGWCKVQKDGKIGLCPANLILDQTFEIEESDEEVIPNDLSGEKKNQLLEKPTSLTSDDGSSTRMTPSPVPLNRSDSDRTDWDGLNLSLTAREMRERIGSRKKSDPRREKLDMRTKYEIIQTRLGTNL